MLRVHNTYRCMAGVPLLTWDPKLQESAEKWAAVGKYVHSPYEYRKEPEGESGENLAWGGMTAYGAAVFWYDEIRYTNPWGVADGPYSGQYVIGHYTQVVWRTSARIGCARGQARYMGVMNTMWVCHYGTGGNFGNYRSYVLPPWRSIEQCGGTRDELPVHAPPSPISGKCFDKRSLAADQGVTIVKLDMSAWGCQQACGKDWNCKSITHCAAGVTGCWLKKRSLTAEDAAAPTDTIAEGGQQCSSYMEAPCRKHYQQRSLVANEGEHIGGIVPFVSYDKCKEVCATTYGCKSFTSCVGGSDTGCWFKKKVVTATDAAGNPPPGRQCTTWFEAEDPALLSATPEGTGSVKQPVIMPAGW